MPKRAKNSTKLGRHELIGAEELLDRYEALKEFFENNWGRIGLELQHLRQPDDVTATLKLVPGVEWCLPFRDEAALGCLIKDGTTGHATWRDLRLTRQMHKDAVAIEDRLSSEYHSKRQKADEATTALKVAISQFVAAISLFPFFFIAALVAEELGVQELTDNSKRLEVSLREAYKERRVLRERLSSQEAWYARNEIVRFVESRRYEGNPKNFAKAMAGLPQYGWLNSFRRCERIEDQSTLTAYPYQLFELLQSIVRKARPLSLGKIEIKLRDALLRENADPRLRGYLAPTWAYMKQAFAECRGKRFKRAELPYKIMGRFLANLERPKSITEVELAKREQLIWR